MTIGALTPRAAHAVAAAMVQVTNTVAAPAITESVGQAASQLVLLHTPFDAGLAPGDLQDMQQVIPGSGVTGTSYIVPAGQNLVITEMDVTSFSSGGALIYLRGRAGSAYVMNTSVYMKNVGTQQARFASGIVYPAESKVTVENNHAVSGTGGADVILHGYLTAN